MMSSQGYKRTNFEEDDYASNGGATPPMDFTSTVAFRGKSFGLHFWKKRTNCEKVLAVFVAVLLLHIVIISVLLALKDSRIGHLQAESKKYCLTPECVNIASILLTSMDRTAEPCEDFYQYACGGWMKNNPIPSGQSRWGTFELMWQKNMLVMRNAIDKPDASFTSTAQLKAKKYFASCMDEDKLIEKAGPKPLLDLISGLAWGINISEWDHGWLVDSKWNLNWMLEELHLWNVASLFTMWVAEDDKNSSIYVLQIDQGGTSLPERNYYLNKSITEDKILSAYLKYMVTTFQLLGAPNETFTREQMIKVIEFETEIANITVPMEDRRDESKLYHSYSLANISKSFPQIKWVHFVSRLLHAVNLTMSPAETRIVLYAPEFMDKLNTILANYVSTEEGKQILTNYFLWDVVSYFAGFLSKPFRDTKKEFLESMSGLTGSDEKWHNCITDTDAVLGFALGGLFVKETFLDGSKEKAKEMIENVREAFISNLPNLDWMDPATQAAAIDKANAIKDMIGYPDFILNDTLLDLRYEKLQINETDYFGNNLASIRYNFLRNFEKLNQKAKNEWDMSPATVNAYYTASKNSIVFPAGILQAPFFDKNVPQSLNYGAMGVVMGHELIHGFDDQGRQYDKFGNMKQWWNPEAVEKFKNETKCIVDQYSQYQLHGEHEKGKQTLGENIADNGGLKSAYNAYKKWVKKNGEEQLLPALGMTHEQIFFLSFSQVWCWNSKPETDHLQVLTDSHSPAKFRVIGPLSNSHEFSEVFKCSSQSSMNPQKKCEVW